VSYQDVIVKFRDRVLSRRVVQVLIFAGILVLSIALLWYGRSRLPPEAFVKHGYLGVFVINLVTCASILFPIPGEAANIAAGLALHPLWVAVAATIGATIGEMTSYIAGYMGGKLFLEGYHKRYVQAQGWMDRHGVLAIFLFALVPVLVYDLMGIIAGSTRYPLKKFVLPTAAGRFIRCLIEAFLGYSAITLLPWV
jgi:membrane protein DedA with SNARE-associated domain